MKTLIFAITLVMSVSSFANTIFCRDTKFSDIEAIKISVYHGDVFVSEINKDSMNTKVTSQDKDGNFEAELSDWNGYTRTLVKFGDSYMIEYADECSGGLVTLKCE